MKLALNVCTPEKKTVRFLFVPYLQLFCCGFLGLVSVFCFGFGFLGGFFVVGFLGGGLLEKYLNQLLH